MEWSQYISSLQQSGNFLVEEEDTLLWTWNEANGTVSAKLAYSALVSKEAQPLIGRWSIEIWRWHCRLKIKLFMWLAMENKNIKLGQLCKEGWIWSQRLCVPYVFRLRKLSITSSFIADLQLTYGT